MLRSAPLLWNYVVIILPMNPKKKKTKRSNQLVTNTITCNVEECIEDVEQACLRV